jgi:hypothetical protein
VRAATEETCVDTDRHTTRKNVEETNVHPAFFLIIDDDRDDHCAVAPFSGCFSWLAVLQPFSGRRPF